MKNKFCIICKVDDDNEKIECNKSPRIKNIKYVTNTKDVEDSCKY